MPLFNENTTLLKQSNSLWQTYFENQAGLVEEENHYSRFSKDFWVNYDALVQKAKTTRVPQKVIEQSQQKTVKSITEVFFKHWTNPFNLQEHLELHPPEEQAKASSNDRHQTKFFVSMLIIFLAGMLALLFGNGILGFLMVLGSVMISLIKASAMDTIDTTDKLTIYRFNVGNKRIKNYEVLFKSTFLHYQFYDFQRERDIKVHIPYTLIASIWKHEQGIKIVGRNHILWKDTQSQVAHEVILPHDKQLQSFLNDVAMFNFTHKS
ncbi:hypothetical protein BKI52_09560 [marine bacterium AO1-C]|nr:hypothetical protein BKI52_09560 [marine bacterium AO1-C]